MKVPIVDLLTVLLSPGDGPLIDWSPPPVSQMHGPGHSSRHSRHKRDAVGVDGGTRGLGQACVRMGWEGNNNSKGGRQEGMGENHNVVYL